MITDPIADMLTKIRNASRAKHPTTEVRASKFTEQILTLLKTEGFIRAYKPVGEGIAKQFRVYLKYTSSRVPAIQEVVRASRPGQRHYRKVDDLPRILNGMGRVILTTSKGVMTDKEAKRQRVGGEMLCYVW